MKVTQVYTDWDIDGPDPISLGDAEIAREHGEELVVTQAVVLRHANLPTVLIDATPLGDPEVQEGIDKIIAHLQGLRI